MGLSGNLSELSVVNLIQLMAHGHKSGSVELAGQEGRPGGELTFADGALVSANCGRMHGEAAFYALAALTEGRFAIETTAAPAAATSETSMPLESLLIESMRRLDEGRRLRAELPLDEPLTRRPQGKPLGELEHDILMLALPGTTGTQIVGALVDIGKCDEYNALQATAGMLESGVLQVVSSS